MQFEANKNFQAGECHDQMYMFKSLLKRFGLMIFGRKMLLAA